MDGRDEMDGGSDDWWFLSVFQDLGHLFSLLACLFSVSLTILTQTFFFFFACFHVSECCDVFLPWGMLRGKWGVEHGQGTFAVD
jgi:hypothetical protein